MFFPLLFHFIIHLVLKPEISHVFSLFCFFFLPFTVHKYNIQSQFHSHKPKAMNNTHVQYHTALFQHQKETNYCSIDSE